jgi:hypothetical protein
VYFPYGPWPQATTEYLAEKTGFGDSFQISIWTAGIKEWKVWHIGLQKPCMDARHLYDNLKLKLKEKLELDSLYTLTAPGGNRSELVPQSLHTLARTALLHRQRLAVEAVIFFAHTDCAAVNAQTALPALEGAKQFAEIFLGCEILYPSLFLVRPRLFECQVDIHSHEITLSLLPSEEIWSAVQPFVLNDQRASQIIRDLGYEVFR